MKRTFNPEMSSTEATQPEFTRWDEDQCKASIARLEQLQNQLDELRLSIPGIVQPLTTTPVRPQEHFRRFKEAVEAEYSRIDHFRATWQSEPITELLEYTLLSGKQDTNVGRGTKLPKYGWAQEAHQPTGEDSKQNDVNGHPNGTDTQKAGDVAAVVEAFKQRHPECHVDSDVQEQKIQASVTTPLGPIVFAVKKSQTPQNEEPRWDVECLGAMKLYPAITRCFANRPRDNDLSHTLEMIAAYKDARRAPCMACGKGVDKSAQTAPARRSKTIKTEDGETREIWEAFHEGCLR